MNEVQRLASLLRVCSQNLSLYQGMQVHNVILRMGYEFDTLINTNLLNMYSKCGKLHKACRVFDKMPERDVVSWTALMCGHLQYGDAESCLLLLGRMGSSSVKPNEFTYSTNLKACGFLGVVENGQQIHGLCCKTGYEWYPVVGNSAVDMYSRCGRIEEAAHVFEKMAVRSLISWNVMIAGYALGNMGDKSLHLFQEMQIEGEMPDEFTFASTLKACAGVGSIEAGKQIHASLITRGFLLSTQTIIAGALVDLYVKCGYLTEAHNVFDLVERKSVLSWTVLIVGYAQKGNLSKARDLFMQLRKSGITIDEFVLSSLMAVFADFALVEQGKQMHALSIKFPSGLETSVGNSIVDMYLKCGLTVEAQKYFDEMPRKDVVSWTVMITGYGKHGLGKDAVNVFEKMLSYRVIPDEVTYLAMLSACSHSGLVEECQKYFSLLCNDRRNKPKVEHYACMVDLLGRAGRLKEARNLIESMPLDPNMGIWQTLLSACKVHGDLEMGREVGEILLKMDDKSPVNYVMISGIYADAGHWKESERIRKSVKNKGLQKEAGQSWVEVEKEVHYFYNGDNRHPLIEKIHGFLKEMERRMKEEIGYASEVRFVLHDVEEESKQESLRLHSEKLAIGLALVCGGVDKGGRTIRIFKNLRVCGDCHEFIKGLSKIVEVVFIVRDANRFHKFESGVCSCGDYW